MSLFFLTHVLALVQIDDCPCLIQLNSDFCSFGKILRFRLLQEKRKGLISLRRFQLDLFLHFANVYELSRHKLMLGLFSFQVHVHDGVVLVDRYLDLVADFEFSTLATCLVFTQLVGCPLLSIDGQGAGLFDDFALEVFVSLVSFPFLIRNR